MNNVTLKYRVYEGTDNGDAYGMTNPPESGENLYVQYKLGTSGTWTTIATHTPQGHSGTTPNSPHDLGTVFTQTLNYSQSATNPLFLRWIVGFSPSGNYDHYGIDDIVIGQDSLVNQSFKVGDYGTTFLAPESGLLRHLHVRWQFPFTGTITATMYKVNNTIPSTEVAPNSENLVSIWTDNTSVTNASEWELGPIATADFDKHDMLILTLKIPNGPGPLGSILGTCTLRFDSRNNRLPMLNNPE